MRIPNKFNGYSADGRRLYNSGGGGGGNTTSTSYQTNIPEYARPYVEQMLGSTQRQLFTGQTDASGKFTPTGFNNFTPYGATYQRDAQGNPMRDPQGNVMYTNTAMDQARAAVAPQSAGQQMAANTVNQYVAPGQTGGASSIAGDVAGRSAISGYYSPLQAERFLIGKPQQIRTDSFTSPYVSQGYMSPYMQNVINVQQREARRQGDIARSQQQAQAVNAGAFGGSRQAILEAERQRNLATQLGDIQAQGLQQAYQQGMGQFNAEQQAYLQAQQANQNINFQRAVQNQQAQMAAQAAQEASRQFGANLGLQGYGQTLQAANLLGQMGQQEYAQDMGTIQAMNQLGAQQQAYDQSIINQDLQNYATAQQYPLMQLGVMSNMLRGLPMQASTTQNYQAQPSFASQAAGALGTGLGLYQQAQRAGIYKEGGVVKMASGGIATGMSAGELGAKLKGPQFTDDVLKKKANDPQTDQATKDLVAAEIARRAELRAGMANGGIIAFAKGKKVKGPKVSDEYPEEFERGTAKGIAQDAQQDAPEVDPYASNVGPYLADQAGLNPAKGDPDKAALYGDQGYAGIASKAAPKELDLDQALLDQNAKLQKYQEEQGGIMAKTPDQVIAERAAAREKRGLHAPYQPRLDKITERREAAKEDAKEQARDNLIMFLQRWGTIPGSTLVAMNQAGKEMVQQSGIDRKEQRKLLDHLDTVESNLHEAEYLRRIGEEDKAQEVIQKAGVEYHRVGKEIVDNTVKLINAKASNEAKIQIAELRDKLAEARASGKQPSDLNVKLDILTQKLAEDLASKGVKVSAASIRAAALQHLETQDIKKAAASAATSLGPKQQQADTSERAERVKTTKDVEAMVDEAVDRDPGKRAAKQADRKAGNTNAMDALRKKHEDAIRSKVGGGSAPAAAPSSSAPRNAPPLSSFQR
jgi:hypothetical protein